MSLFEPENSFKKKPGTFRPFYRVYTLGADGEQIDHDPACGVEAVAVGNTAHYVVKNPDGTIDAMYPFSSVECVYRVTQEEDAE